MDIKFVCPHCNQRLRVDSSRAGRPVRCPTCKEPTRVPVRPPAPPAARPAASPSAGPATRPSTPPPAASPKPPPQSDTVFCTKCGQPNIENNYQCTRCGFLLHGPAQPPVVVDEPFSGMIPYKNSRALAAYYFGIFSLIPCVGIPLGVTALILGILGLKYANKHPEAKGEVHAWVGVVLGALTAVGYILLLVISIITGALA